MLIHKNAITQNTQTFVMSTKTDPVQKTIDVKNIYVAKMIIVKKRYNPILLLCTLTGSRL